MSKIDSIETRYHEILNKLTVIINYLEELGEDPIFIDTIHGEQEMGLDLTLELLETIKSQFEPQVASLPYRPLLVDDSYDAN
jgi:signal transduction histidine kinase